MSLLLVVLHWPLGECYQFSLQSYRKLDPDEVMSFTFSFPPIPFCHMHISTFMQLPYIPYFLHLWSLLACISLFDWNLQAQFTQKKRLANGMKSQADMLSEGQEPLVEEIDFKNCIWHVKLGMRSGGLQRVFQLGLETGLPDICNHKILLPVANFVWNFS